MKDAGFPGLRLNFLFSPQKVWGPLYFLESMKSVKHVAPFALHLAGLDDLFTEEIRLSLS